MASAPGVDVEMGNTTSSAILPATTYPPPYNSNSRTYEPSTDRSQTTVYGCTVCTLFRTTQDPNHISSDAAKHYAAGNENVFLYYACPGCWATCCTTEGLVKHFTEGCWAFNEWRGGRYWTNDRGRGRSLFQIAKDSCQWTKSYKAIAKARILERGASNVQVEATSSKPPMQQQFNNDAKKLEHRPKIKLKLRPRRKAESEASSHEGNSSASDGISRSRLPRANDSREAFR
ncbi:Hypothetical predicted protein [Lecanosticta acicola]|uniref:Uncharacterized protein n=1 Tax=Lecanosticta acicola TaxID=111012 RepID=A0AAI8YW18_9PEZI|nr:Hypothetical predicted protein [Lecanosticta acicola]